METSKSAPPPPAPIPAPFRLPTEDDLPKLPFAKVEEMRQHHPGDYKKLLLSGRMDEKAKRLGNLYGKLLYAERRQYDAGIREGLFSGALSFRGWFEESVGKFPDRAYSYAKVFGTFCRADGKAPWFVPETVYDNLTSRVVQVASKIVNITKEMRPSGPENQVLRDVANVLRLGEKNAFEQLEQIEKRLVEKPAGKGDNEQTTISYISPEELAAHNLKAAAEDTNGELHRIVGQVGIPAVTALLLSKAQNTSDRETAKSLCQMAVQILSKLSGNVTEGDWTKPDANGKSVRATVPRFPPRQLQEWENEVCEKGIREMSEEDKRTEYCSALDRLKEIEKATERETIEQWVSEKGILVHPATPPQTSGPIPLLKTAGGIVAVERWRFAELQVLKWLLNWGWQVKDVSEQNMGYDIGGRDSKAQDAFVEVKSINYPGASFSLTSNEYAVAAAKGPSYHVALVPPQTGTNFEVFLIRDPTKLKHSQKCLKWEWIFDTYPLD